MVRTSVLPSSVLRRSLLAGAAVTAGLILSACGGDHSPPRSGMDGGAMTMTPSTADSAGVAAFNNADVTFAQSMIPHDRQAVQMAAVASGRASDTEVKALASKIRATRQPEIDIMNEWLTAWDQPVSMPGMSGGSNMAGLDHGALPGMLTDADVGRLMGAKGKNFDKQFLAMMITHHKGAISMAQQEAADGSNTEATALARKIITDEQAEITTMQGMFDRLA